MEKALRPAARGVRFAPSPTGRFHIGNLRTAWISSQWARAWGEPWVVRFEDIDGPRNLAGAREQQLADMATLGLVPDEVVIQSQRHARHWEAFERAVRDGRVYPCFCSRQDVREALERSGSAPHPRAGALPPTYSGHCRSIQLPPSEADHGLPSLAWRFAIEEDPSGRSDFIVGRSAAGVDEEGRPADPSSYVPAYHWACSVDDLDGGYRLLVRAADLLEVLPQHRAIMRWLAAREGSGAALPAVFHASLVTQNDGHRLEKRTQGVTLTELAGLGVDPARVLELFERSWGAAMPGFLAAWREGCVLGEARAALTLSELGLG